MSRDDLIKIDGVVTEATSGGTFLVKLVDERVVKAKLSGRLRRFHIRVLAGDRVTLGISPYDVSHGLILTREKLESRGPRSSFPRR
jgi:translation initiation factor IF-1